MAIHTLSLSCIWESHFPSCTLTIQATWYHSGEKSHLLCSSALPQYPCVLAGLSEYTNCSLRSPVHFCPHWVFAFFHGSVVLSVFWIAIVWTSLWKYLLSNCHLSINKCVGFLLFHCVFCAMLSNLTIFLWITLLFERNLYP